MLDLDGDGREQTGWNLLYLHLDDEGRVPEGAFVEQGDRLGHPSCKGGEPQVHTFILPGNIMANGSWQTARCRLP